MTPLTASTALGRSSMVPSNGRSAIGETVAPCGPTTSDHPKTGFGMVGGQLVEIDGLLVVTDQHHRPAEPTVHAPRCATNGRSSTGPRSRERRSTGRR